MLNKKHFQYNGRQSSGRLYTIFREGRGFNKYFANITSIKFKIGGLWFLPDDSLGRADDAADLGRGFVEHLRGLVEGMVLRLHTAGVGPASTEMWD